MRLGYTPPPVCFLNDVDGLYGWALAPAQVTLALPTELARRRSLWRLRLHAAFRVLGMDERYGQLVVIILLSVSFVALGVDLVRVRLLA